jgi:hypothetical protein
VNENTQSPQAFAEEWLRAWNHRDLEAILAHYADYAEQHSPLVVRLLGDTSGVVIGKSNLRDYFQKALAVFPGELDLELLGVFQGVNSLIVQFKSRGGLGAELMELNAEGAVRRGTAHFGVTAAKKPALSIG